MSFVRGNAKIMASHVYVRYCFSRESEILKKGKNRMHKHFQPHAVPSSSLRKEHLFCNSDPSREGSGSGIKACVILKTSPLRAMQLADAENIYQLEESNSPRLVVTYNSEQSNGSQSSESSSPCCNGLRHHEGRQSDK